MRTDHVLRRSLCLLFFAAIGLARSMSAQSMERGKQLFDNAKYAAAKTELLAVHKKRQSERRRSVLPWAHRDDHRRRRAARELDSPAIHGATETGGAKDLAREQYQTALKINPKSQPTQRALVALAKSK